MFSEKFRKIAALSTIIVLILDLVLFFSGIVDILVFWLVIIVGAVIAFKVIPKMK